MAERPDLWQLESDLHAQGYGTLCGVDEAGAGPLAGRVYAPGTTPTSTTPNG